MRKLSEELIRQKLSGFGYKLLSPYTNSSTPSLLECPSGHRYMARMGNFFHRKARCPECDKENISKRCKIPWDTVVSIAQSKNFKILTNREEYEKNHKKNKFLIKIICRCGEYRKISYTGLRITAGCLSCKGGSEKRRKTYEKVKKEIQDLGYHLLTEVYKNNKQKLKLECYSHGIFHINMNDLLDGHRCVGCSSGNSNQHKEIIEYLNNFCEFLINDRKQIYPFELDIYIPTKGVAIEYCGLWWHNEEKKERNYHNKKREMCEKQGIQLITIFEDEWLERRAQIENILKAKLGLLPKIPARKCQVMEITKKESDLFIDKYHLQGSTRSTLYLGLFYENELVAVITGGPHHRQGQEESFVLNRLCFGPYAVLGGSSKLFKYFKEKAIALGYNRIVSWSDNRWSDGKVYEKLGFALEEEMKVDYSYCKNQKRFSKQSCQKKHLLKKGAVGNTEKEMALSLGYKRIWDCGKKRWSFNL